jgi:pimeloyl-ACP methyl ester carboxylesterase
MPSDCVPVHGHDLYIERHGPPDRPAVILLHHGLGAVHSWIAQIPVLVDAGFHVLAYDRWGYGRSQARTEFSMPAFRGDLDDLAFILEYYGFARVCLVGHSDGGTIALYYAAEHPNQIERLVTVAAHIYVEPKMESGIEDTRRAYEQNERFRTGLRRLHGEKVDQVLYGWYTGWYRSGNLQWDMRPTLARIDCPVLVVQGEADEHATPQHARDLAKALPNADLWLVPDGSHMLAQEHPKAFNCRLLAFLQA